MMPLTEIDRLKQTVAGSWGSPVADKVAAQWGYPAGTAKWWRSSAFHVFVLPEDGHGASAVRDLADPTGRAAGEHRDRFGAFVAGYRSLRPLDDQDLDRLPLFAGLHAAASLVRIARALGEPGRGEPEWLAGLRGKLTGKARVHRQLVISTAGQVG